MTPYAARVQACFVQSAAETQPGGAKRKSVNDQKIRSEDAGFLARQPRGNDKRPKQSCDSGVASHARSVKKTAHYACRGMVDKIAGMAAGMNGLDYALIAIIGFGALYGLAHGVLRMATSILSFAMGIYAAWAWHERATALAQYHLGTAPAASGLIAYIAVFVMVFVAIEFAGHRLISLAHIVNLNLVDRLGGALVGALLGTIFAGLDIVILTAVLPPDYSLLQNTRLAPTILSYDKTLLDYVPPDVKALYQEKHDQLLSYWNSKNRNPVTAPAEAR